MAVDIFNRTAPAKIKRTAADRVKLVITGITQPLFVQQLQWNYAQRVSRLYDLGDPTVLMFVAGRPEGTLALAHIVTNPNDFAGILGQIGDVCKDADSVITVNMPDSSCSNVGLTGNVGSFQFHHCILSNVGMSISVADYIVTDNLQIMFTYVDTGKK